MKKFIFFFGIVLILINPSPPQAHVLKNSASELDIQGRSAKWKVAVHLGDFEAKFGQAPEERIKAYIQKRLSLKVGKETCKVEGIDLKKDLFRQRVDMTLTYLCPEAPVVVGVDYNLFYGDWNHRHLMKLVQNGKTFTYNFSPGNTSAEFTTLSFWRTFWNFFKLGWEHILIGYDHILFILTLILGALRFSHLFWLVTSFTLAHSASLALATLGWVDISPALVEPLIALSIIILACLDLFTSLHKEPRGIYIITFAFGLIHGLGFSQILKESGITGATMLNPLLSFNLGVEAGQVLIIAIVYPLLFLLKRVLRGSYRYVRIGFLCVIVTVAAYWFVERILGFTRLGNF